MTSRGIHDSLEDVRPRDANLDFVNHLQAGPGSSPEIPSVSYKCYKFFKADPIPGQEASWTKVERIEMDLSQEELREEVHRRADKFSAGHQYQALSEIRQAHVNRLIHEHREMFPWVDWSCVYAKQIEQAAKARNANREDYETVSMTVILMQRPLQTLTHPRTPMGELVDLRQRHTSLTHVAPSTTEQPQMTSPSNQSLLSDQWTEEPQIWLPSGFPDSDLGEGHQQLRSIMTVDGTVQTPDDEVTATEAFDDFNEANIGR
ncbi:uncharacterized protein N7483_002495 [Penicillium malachiteum]|uniref:uncharacterized protein n=1 Tax=Penicillium malachiteum TaxID=1324776 RepID=UPI002549BBCA|nr:uncharacterized protein N7483_002495 [Penicillium malachiteum]KAJ5737370.1 hypothetical protein N7483_002495 [Penicillium malachiteum]